MCHFSIMRIFIHIYIYIIYSNNMFINAYTYISVETMWHLEEKSNATFRNSRCWRSARQHIIAANDAWRLQVCLTFRNEHNEWLWVSRSYQCPRQKNRTTRPNSWIVWQVTTNLLVGELEPAIRAKDDRLATANAGENKKILNATNVEHMAARTADDAHIAAVEVIHANSTSGRMKGVARGRRGPRVME